MSNKNQNNKTKENKVIEAMGAEMVEGTQPSEVIEAMGAEMVEGTPDAKEDATPEQKKASQILRAQLPNLQEARLNFEKRTGSFFRATLVKETVNADDGKPKVNEKGEPIYKRDEHGQIIEKTSRLTVDLDAPENQATAEKCADEINAKRSSAFILNAETAKAKLLKDKADAEAKLKETDEALAKFDEKLETAKAIVMSTVLPERATTEKVSEVRAKLESVEEQNKKMRQMLIDAGFDPDNM